MSNKYLDFALREIVNHEVNDVLDKIRAEIESSRWTNKDIRIERNALASGLDKALEIIDKYRTESGDKCKNCKYYRNPDYTRCHKCKAESEGKE